MVINADRRRSTAKDKRQEPEIEEARRRKKEGLEGKEGQEGSGR